MIASADKKRRRRQNQRGFTLIELLVASTTGLILMLSVGAVLSDTLRSADAISSRIDVNRHAREIFDILALGGAVPNANTTAQVPASLLDFNYVFGLRGRSNVGTPAAPWTLPTQFMVRNNAATAPHYRFALSVNENAPNDGTADAVYRLMAEEIRDVTASCSDYNLPLRGCAAAGDTVAEVRGFLRAEPQFEKTYIVNNVVEIGFQLTDPRRLNSPRLLLTGGKTPYWTAFAAMQGKAPW
ncbi:MAG TPA: prepilin-type N-terminal cleavage/methylation domain-containing protein [Azospirillaceae bacterium]|nr:prepilin-type N-terminal cleavage/methylation domain-containing protein [Azospirillaceae bacterium]HRQ79540.1 prepilin-type N-terminal cleavage/methylation domain-containing protein [Azospirillaceae bacterium]